jgi:hypothetical protein
MRLIVCASGENDEERHSADLCFAGNKGNKGKFGEYSAQTETVQGGVMKCDDELCL